MLPKVKNPWVGLLIATVATIVVGRLLIMNFNNSRSDSYLWLEEVESEKSLDWVKQQNKETRKQFGSDARFKQFSDSMTEMLNDDNRILTATMRGEFAYNFWQDEENPKGLWRRTSKESYFSGNPKWDVLLDIDKLSEDEKEKWVFKGADCLSPKFDRCLLKLSRGGKDAMVVREFDVPGKAFVTDEPFNVPEAKTQIDWADEDTVLVGADFGEGTLADSGYPMQVRLWKRGQPLREAKLIFEGEKSDIAVGGYKYITPEGDLTLVGRYKTFWETIYRTENKAGELVEIPLPIKADIETYFAKKLVVQLKDDWKFKDETFVKNSIVAVSIDALVDGGGDLVVTEIFRAGPRQSVSSVGRTRNGLLIELLDNVNGKLLFASLVDNVWEIVPIDLPKMGKLAIQDTDSFSSDALVTYEDFLVPESLYLLEDTTLATRILYAAPDRFDSRKFKVTQLEAKSKDGTMIPYYQVEPRDRPKDEPVPTILYGYGGFEIPMTPFYSEAVGTLWLEKGGAFVLANIRGGGEFGPNWHEGGMLLKKQNTFDDFIAVGETLVDSGLTSPEKMGIMGGSNGGLLVGATMNQRPELFGAVVCQVPLLDMLRYTKLPPGNIWSGEYGDPEDSEMGDYIAKYSPYQNVKAGGNYPDVLFVTSTKDDRVHPGHARKMAAKMRAMNYNAHLFERIDGGHAADTNPNERADRLALEYSFLHQTLFD